MAGRIFSGSLPCYRSGTVLVLHTQPVVGINSGRSGGAAEEAGGRGQG